MLGTDLDRGRYRGYPWVYKDISGQGYKCIWMIVNQNLHTQGQGRGWSGLVPIVQSRPSSSLVFYRLLLYSPGFPCNLKRCLILFLSQICRLYRLVCQQLPAGAGQGNASCFQYIPLVGNPQGHVGVLLD